MSGPQCCTNPPILSSSSGEGHVEEIGGFNSYVSGSSDSSKLAILLISDIFGYEAPKLRQIADKVSAAGFYAVVPDLLYGEPYVTDSMEGSLQGWMENPRRPIRAWMEDHNPAKGCEDSRKLIAALKSKGFSAIGLAGFCWGAMVLAKLAKFDDIQAGVALHPGTFPVEDINEVKVPIAILGAEFDDFFPPETAKHTGEILSAKHVDNFVKIYPGVYHGWTTRYKDDEDDSFVRMSAMEAHSDMLSWLSKYVK